MLNIRFREKTNAWPGFVDLFSNLVIILMFLLIVFVFLWTTTSVFNKKTGTQAVAELEKTNKAQAEQIVEMTDFKNDAENLLTQARDAILTQEQMIETQKMDLAKGYEQKVSDLQAQQAELAQQIADLTTQLQIANAEKEEIAQQIAATDVQQEQLQNDLSQLSQEKSLLNDRITELEDALDKAEEIAKQKEVEYVELSTKLNKALADKVAELNTLSEYQSDFYKQIKLALGNRTSIQQDGDRFIVSSDILFASGSWSIAPDGKNQLRLLANIIKDFEAKIPSDINWIIRVDGHTDKKDVVPGTRGYTNNMQLSLLRATSVVNELVKNGVSKRRLVPSGFGELHPIELGDDEASLQKNRRIELQLTNK
ncbi:MAG: OmpA family protein [Alphaproteobacteria bacterium]|nr:OmpA family protein [Alphaproteobacteria bacterium]